MSLLNQLADNIEHYGEQASGKDDDQAHHGDLDRPPPPPPRVAGVTDQGVSSQRHRRESPGEALDSQGVVYKGSVPTRQPSPPPLVAAVTDQDVETPVLFILEDGDEQDSARPLTTSTQPLASPRGFDLSEMQDSRGHHTS